MIDEMYHNCRYCKHNLNNACVRIGAEFEKTGYNSAYQMVEDGRLYEAIEESLQPPKFDYLKSLLDEYKLSQKRKGGDPKDCRGRSGE